VAASRFAQIERAWNAGEIPVLLAQPQSVAHGLNLQGTAATVIWHSLTWDLELREQFIRRVWRQGQKEKVIVHDIVARDTVDEVIMLAMAGKDKTQKALLAALSTYAGVRHGK
jgi:SNF2 family DNA or RNA helicase